MGRIRGTMFILSYPFISIRLSTLSFAAGRPRHLTSLGAGSLKYNRLSALVMTAARSEVAALNHIGYTLLAGPLSCAFLSVWIAQKRVGVVSNGDSVVVLCGNCGHTMAVDYGIGLRKNMQDTLPSGYLGPVSDVIVHHSRALLSHLK